MYLNFNSSPSTWMHIDLNSCFATIEQQANPLLRGKPIAVAAYITPHGCILAPSIEAKRYGVKTGMRVMDGKKLCPQLLILASDPPKYRFVNQALLKLLKEYCPYVSVRSIDEMLLNFADLPILKFKTMFEIGAEIKQRIKSEIGEWLMVSVGISTNPYLAKVAAAIRKPDGLDEINQHTILSVLSTMKLIDLPYIKERNQIRLNRVGIKTPLDFYLATPQKLTSAFASITGDYWYLRLHGKAVDEVDWQRRSIGHSYALPQATSDRKQLEKLLCKLVVKMGRRIRRNNFTVQGMHLTCSFVDGGFWHHGQKLPHPLYFDNDLFRSAQQLLSLSPPKPIRVLAVSSFLLAENLYGQLTFFRNEEKQRALTAAVDKINNRWGEFALVPGLMMNMDKTILDRIGFGVVRDMPKVTLQSTATITREVI